MRFSLFLSSPSVKRPTSAVYASLFAFSLTSLPFLLPKSRRGKQVSERERRSSTGEAVLWKIRLALCRGVSESVSVSSSLLCVSLFLTFFSGFLHRIPGGFPLSSLLSSGIQGERENKKLSLSRSICQSLACVSCQGESVSLTHTPTHASLAA